MRPYEETHPWITFSLDMTRFDHRAWLALGEAASKCDHIAGVPLMPVVAEMMHDLYLAKGALATTAIEGNTLSEDEVNKHLRGELQLPPSQQYLATEIDNIVGAVNHLTESIAKDGHQPVTIDLLKWMNTQVLAGLEVEDGVAPGEIRQHRVAVGKYRCPSPGDCDFLLERFCERLNAFPMPEGQKTAYSIVKAIYAHIYFVWIHPFGDGNGRTARLLELYILLSAGCPQPVGHLLSNHYNKTRNRYYHHLDAAVQSDEKFCEFFLYAIEGFVDGVRGLIDFIREQQRIVTWVNYVHDHFRDRKSQPDNRRRDLVLALTRETKPLRPAEMMAIPTFRALYGDRSLKTVMRDLMEMHRMGLIAWRKEGAVANREMINAFLPWRNQYAESGGLPKSNPDDATSVTVSGSETGKTRQSHP